MAKKNISSYYFLKGKSKKYISRFFGTKNYQKLIILGRQRTGSSLLMRLLHAHPKIDMQSEVFRLLKGKSCRNVWNETFSKKLPWIKYAGFKLFYNHPDDSKDREVWDILDSNTDVKIIHIKRKNILRTYVSKLVAVKTGAWNSGQENDQKEDLDKKVHIDLNHCLNELRTIKKLEAEFNTDKYPNHEYIELFYEELVENTVDELNKLFSFLKIENQRIEKRKLDLKRQNPEKMKNLVINYEEFEQAISNSEFAKLLDE